MFQYEKEGHDDRNQESFLFLLPSVYGAGSSNYIRSHRNRIDISV